MAETEEQFVCICHVSRPHRGTLYIKVMDGVNCSQHMCLNFMALNFQVILINITAEIT